MATATQNKGDEAITLALELAADMLGMTKEELSREILGGNKSLENSVSMLVFMAVKGE